MLIYMKYMDQMLIGFKPTNVKQAILAAPSVH